MSKVLTISIAAYNVEKYIENTLKSILIDDIEDLEILVEDDGGTDGTANIVKQYEKEYPDIVKLIHKENGGYGSTINKSIELARGKYFKQLDGDDWYNTENFKKILMVLRENDVDIVYSPIIEHKDGKNEERYIDYFEENINGIYNIEDIINKSKDALTMHTLLYKTEVLKKCKLKLLEKCFYTDTQYAMFPIASAKNILITHLPIYMYRIGLAEQSISVNSHRKHYKEHARVSMTMVEYYNMHEQNLDSNLKKYIFNYTKTYVANSIARFYMVVKPSQKCLNEIKEFDNRIMNENLLIYDAVGKHSKIVRILRKTKYNFFVYMVLSILKTISIKKEQK